MSTAPRPDVIETQLHAAGFGMGWWDPVAGRLVSEGLAVHVARLAGNQAVQAVAANANRSGIFAAHGLPALRAFEAGGRATPARHLVTVRDTRALYLSHALEVWLPGAAGIVLPACIDALWPDGEGGSPPPPRGAWVPLFPLPAYPVPAGFAAVRAACIDDATGEPAAFAVIELRHDGRLLARAVSDARGEALAVFPYPEPAPAPVFSPGSPPGPPAAATPVAASQWPLDIAVRWRRGLPTHAAPGAPQARLPELCELLTQPAAEAADEGSPPLPVRDAILRHGADLVLGRDRGARLRIRTP